MPTSDAKETESSMRIEVAASGRSKKGFNISAETIFLQSLQTPLCESGFSRYRATFHRTIFSSLTG